ARWGPYAHGSPGGAPSRGAPTGVPRRPPRAGSDRQGRPFVEMSILFVVLAGLMFFMSSRSRKQQRAQQEFRSQLAPGQEVMTGSGMFGTVVEIDDASDTVTIESAPGSQTRWLRAAIAKRVDTPVEDEDETVVTDEAS